MKTYVSALSLLAALLVGCNNNELSHKLAQANRVVLSGPGAEIIVTGDEMHEIINAVASAKRREDRWPTGYRMIYEVGFYQGTNCLGSIHTWGGCFTADWRLSKPIKHGFVYFSADREKIESLIEQPLRKASEAKQKQK